MPMLNKSKTLTGTVPVCLWRQQGRNEPCRLIPGRARKDTLSLLPGLISAWQRHAPGPSMGSNYLDTPLIPDDTPVTEKRQRSLLPSGFRRHITVLRHTASFGS